MSKFSERKLGFYCGKILGNLLWKKYWKICNLTIFDRDDNFGSRWLTYSKSIFPKQLESADEDISKWSNMGHNAIDWLKREREGEMISSVCLSVYFDGIIIFKCHFYFITSSCLPACLPVARPCCYCLVFLNLNVNKTGRVSSCNSLVLARCRQYITECCSRAKQNKQVLHLKHFWETKKSNESSYVASCLGLLRNCLTWQTYKLKKRKIYKR